MNKSKKHIKMEHEKTLFQLFKIYLEFIHYKNNDRPQKTLDELLVGIYEDVFGNAKPSFDFAEIKNKTL